MMMIIMYGGWYDSAQHRWSAHAYDLRTYAENHRLMSVTLPRPYSHRIRKLSSHNSIAIIDHVMSVYDTYYIIIMCVYRQYYVVYKCRR